jgi:ADP-heptose:LPS heptosyltransferase
MNTAVFVNGGAGRVLCAIPALEKHLENNPEAIVVTEAWAELFLASPKIRDRCFVPNTKNLFENYIKDRKIITPEPYRVNAYYNQKCNLMQAFDIEINNEEDVPEALPLELSLSRHQQVNAYNFLEQAKKNFNKDKVVVFQPFGQGANVDGRFIVDGSGRSFELKQALEIIEEIKKEAVVVIMSSFQIPTEANLGVVYPEGMDLLGWMGVINAADYVLGCDSVAQHMANAFNKKCTVVTGATYPENITYENNPDFKVIDNGKDKRTYSPIRVLHDPCHDLNNEDLMVLDQKTLNEVIESVKEGLKNE